MVRTEKFEKVEITAKEELRNWLEVHHSQEESVWLVTYKKTTPGKYVSRWDVLDELICFGWIDGVRRKLDAERTMQLISPRKVQHWAQTYKDTAAKLISANKMHESGLKSIEISKSNGMWNFMDDVDKLIVPDDLAKALSQLSQAEVFFNSLNDSSKRFVLRWVKLAKTEKTRVKRIQELVRLSAKGEKLKGS
ncbi:MAG: YdeI/OmpD-associated family protein [Bacteroidota bacterium]